MTALPTPTWAQPPLVLTDQHLRRWAALVLMAVRGWAVQLLGWVLFSTSLMSSQTQKPINLAWMMINLKSTG